MSETGTTGTTGTRTLEASTPVIPSPPAHTDRVPVVPVVPVPGGATGTVPALLRPFASAPPRTPVTEPAINPLPTDPPPSFECEAIDDDDFIELSPEDIPTCPRCNDLCDVQTLDDRWHCTRCNPDEAEQRRKRTQHWLRTAERLRRQYEND